MSRHLIASDAWSSRESVVVGQEAVVEGAITVSPLVRELKGFDEYFTRLTPQNNHHNPWFAEYWEDFFSCKLANFTTTPYNSEYAHWCADNKQISPATGYKQLPTLHFVRDAVYAFAFALHNMHKDKCNGLPGLCAAMDKIDGAELKHYIEKVTFKGKRGHTDLASSAALFLPTRSCSFLFLLVLVLTRSLSNAFRRKLEDISLSAERRCAAAVQHHQFPTAAE